MKRNQDHISSLPLKRGLTLIYVLSLIIAAVTAAASVAGLLGKTAIYPTAELLESFLPTDVSILCIGLPMLLVSMLLTRRGKLIGLLLWPGALLFVLYTYLAYIFAMPLSASFLLHLGLVGLSAYTLIGLVAGIDSTAVRPRLAGAVRERLSGGIMAGLGVLFFVRAFVVMAGALGSRSPMAETELAVNISDFLIAPTWVICGVLLWRRTAFGYAAGPGLLFQASMLFVGLIIVMLLQPLIGGTSFSPFDFAAVFAMSLVSFVPFGLFVHGVVSNQEARKKGTPR